MNHVYRLKRSGRSQQIQAVPETARTSGKGSRTGKTLGQAVLGAVLKVAWVGVFSLSHAQQAPPSAQQLPQGGVVTRGHASINTGSSPSGLALMTVNQASERAVIDWSTFDVGSQAKVHFNQPSSSAVVLNNVLGNNASQIYGQISANGQVFLSNPNGVYFAPTAQVNVGGLVATTGKANADEFMAGRARFARDGSNASVINEGQLTAVAGGYIAMLAPEVRNQGLVVAQAGTVALASGEAITLSFNNAGTGLVGITTTPQVIAALVENRSAVIAEGGQIILSAHALATLQGSVVKNSGQLSATSLIEKGGKVVLMAESIELTSTSQIEANGPQGGGTVLVGGDWQGRGDTRQARRVTMVQGARIEANATQNGDGGQVVLWSDVNNPDSVTSVNGRIQAEAGPMGGDGGRVETSSSQLSVDDLQVSTRAHQGQAGQWLLDPYNIVISTGTTSSGVTASGGVYSTNADSTINYITLQNALASGNVEVSTAGAVGSAGNISVAAPISWTGPYTLKLNALGAISGTGNISMGTGGSLIFSQASTTASSNIYSGIISGAGSFTKEGAGTAVLTGANTYTGTTTISAGRLQFGNGGATATALMGTGNVVNNATLAFDAATNQNFSPNTISGTGAVIVSGAAAGSGTLTLRDDNTFSGGITINAGPRVTAGGNSTGAAGAVTAGPFGTGVVTLNTNGQLELGGYNIANGIKANFASASPTSHPTIFASTGTSELSGQLDLTLASSGIKLSPALNSTLRLTGTLNTSTTDNNSPNYATKLQQIGAGNVYEGFSSINASYHIVLSATAGRWTLASDPGNAIGLGTKANVTLSGGTFDTAGNDLSSGLSTERRKFYFSGGTLTNSASTRSKIWAIDTYFNANTTIYTPNVGGDIDFSNSNYFYTTSTVRTLTKSGPGELHMNGAFASGGNVDFNFNLLAGNLQFYAQGATDSFSGAYSLAAGSKIILNTGVTFRGAISGGGSVVIRANSTLSGANTYTGGTSVINNATLTLGRAAVMSGNTIVSSAVGKGDITLGDASTAATLSLGGYASLPHNIIVNGTATLFSGSTTVNQTISGAISDGSNAGKGLSLNAAVSGKTMEVTGNNTYTGTTTVSGSGEVLISHANALGSSAAGTNIGTGTLKLKGGITVNETLTMTAGTTSVLGNLSGNNTLTGTLTHASGNTTVSSDAGTLTLAPATGNAIDYGSSTTMVFTGAGNIVVNGTVAGTTAVTKSGAGMLTLAGNNSFTGAISLNQGTLRAASNTALGTVAEGITVASGATLQLGGPASPDGIAIGNELLTVNDGGAIRNVAGYNTYAGTMSLKGNATITVDTGTRLNFTATGSAISVANSKRITFNLTEGDLTIARALNGTTGSSYIKIGGGTLTTGGFTNMAAATGVYVGLFDPSGSDYSTVYGSTPDLTYAFYTSSTGATPITFTGFSGTPTWSGGTPIAGSAAGGYALTYNTGITITNAAYALVGPTVAKTWTVTPKVLSLAGLTVPSSKTYDGTTLANVSGTPGLLAAVSFAAGNSSDGKPYTGDTITFSGTLAGNYNSKDVATANLVTFSGLTSNNSNYSLAGTQAATITPAALTMTAQNASKLIGQADPSFTATYSGFVNGETAAVLSGVGVTRTGSDTAANTYTGVLVPTASSTNYTITPVNGNFTIVPADTLLVTLGNASKAYGANVSGLSATAAQYVTSGNVLRTVTLTAGANGSYTFDDGLGTSGSFLVGTSASSASGVGNYGITLSNFVKSGSNFTSQTSQAGNLVVNPLAVTLGAVNVSKVYDGNAAAQATVLVANKVGADDVSVQGVGSYTDNKNVGSAHTYSLSAQLAGAASGNYYLGSTTLTGSDGVITPAALTVSGITAANKTYDGSTAATVSVAGVVKTGLIGGEDVTVSATGVFANKSAANGKTVTLTSTYGGADVGNYTITDQSTATANITPAALTISGITAANKVYDGTTAATVSVASVAKTGLMGSDDVTVSSTGVFANKNVANGKTVNLTNSYAGADVGNYTIADQSTATANVTPAALTMTAQNASKLIGQADPSFMATYSGFVNGETAAVLSGVGVTRTGSDTAANTYTGVLVPTASSTNYTITPVNGNFTIVPADTLLVTLGNASKAYGANVSGLSATAAQYVTSGNVLRTVTLTAGANGSYTFDDGLGTSGSFLVGTSASSASGVGNYGITLSNFVKSGSNFTSQTSQAGNLVVNPLAVTLGAVNVSKVYDGNAAAQATVLVANKVGADDVSVQGVGSYTDNKNVGSAHTYSLSAQLAGAASGNYYLGSTTLTGSDGVITPAALTVSGITAANKTYDANRNATLSGTAAVTALGSDVVTVSGTGAGLFADKNVGTGKAVTVSGYTLSGADAGNYSIVQPTGLSADITAAALTVSGITADNKTYNANRTATLSGTAAVTALGSDVVTVSGTGAGLFADKNVGTGKAVTVSGYTLSGADAGNYSIVQPTGLSADITAADLQVNGITADNKTYNANRTATLSGTAAVTALGSDVVTVSGTGAGLFADKNVGTGKAVTVSGYTLSGADAGNYSIVQPTGLSADITAADLQVNGITADNKTYNANRTANLTGTAAVTALGSDVVTVSGTGAGLFADKNVGTGKAVTVSGYTLSGADAGNYSIVQPTGLSADITAADLQVNGITADNKTYNANRTANLTGTAAVTALGSDVVTVSGTGAGLFADKNVGTGKAVTVSGYTLSGADAGNYSIVQPTGLSADITAADLQVNGITADNKTYNANRTATLSGTAAVTALGSDVVTVSGTGAGLFADKNVGTGKAVTVSGYTLSGADAANYSIVQPTGLSADITAADLQVNGITADNKTYNANRTANLTGTAAVTALGSDVVTVSGTGAGLFADKNVGRGKAVTVSGYTLSGADAGNYSIVQPTGLSADITAADLQVNGITADNKTYNANRTANLTGTAAVTALGSDVVTVSGTGAGLFADKNVGTGKAVTVSGYTLSGADAGNYSIVQPTGLSADITAADLQVNGITADNKTYNANRTANLTGTAAVTALGSDVVTVSGTGAGLFADKNVGTGKAVTVSGYTLSGADAGNYSIVQPTGLSADITAAALTVSGITADNKTYNANRTATLSGTAAVTALGSDVVTVSGTGAGLFADKNVGTGKAVTVSGYTLSGADAANYSIVQPTGLSADITAAALTVSGITADNKTYNGSTAATVSVASVVKTGLMGSDDVTVSATGVFANKNVANGKTVTLTSTYGGADAGNYTITDQSTATANITPAALTVSGITAANKTYDGSTAATVSVAGVVKTGLIGGEDVTVSATGVFANKSAANGKTVTLTSTYGGADVGNYTITDQSTATANITPAALTISGITAANKVYDGTTAATVSVASVAKTGLMGSDDVTVSSTGVFANKNVANGKTVNLTNSYAGADVGNYTIADQSTATANVTPAALTMTAQNASKLIGQADPSFMATYSGFVNGETAAVLSGVGVTRTGSDTAANTYTGVLVPTASSTNYTITPVNGNFTIVPADTLLVTLGNASKAYGANVSGLSATAAQYVTSGNVLRTVTLTAGANGSYTFDDGLGTSGSFLVGTSASSASGVGNYGITLSNFVKSGSNFTSQTSQAGNLVVNPLAVTLGAVNVSKVYDGNAAAQATVLVANKVGADDVSVQGVGSYTDNKNVGSAHTYSLSAQLAGAASGNYYLGSTTLTGSDGVITPAALTVSGITAANKTYDANRNATLSGTAAVTALGSDVVTVSGTGAGLFADKNVGTGKAVTVSGYTLSGADAGNYSIVQPTGLSADITAAALTVSGITADNKTYNANRTATLSGTAAVTALGSDVVTVSGTGAGLFADKNVGTGKAVTVSGYTLSGADAGNYSIVQPTGLSADITAADLQVNGITADNKTYNANRTATLSGTAAVTALGSDVVTVSGTGAGLFADKNVGTGKAVTVSGYTLSGADAGNYSIVQPTGLSADITAADLQVNGITADNKTYNANRTATLSGTAAVTALGSDVVTVSGTGAGLFADKNVGTGKAVTVSGYTLSGADAGNYSIVQPTGLSADITAADLQVNGITADNKTYNANRTANLTGTAAVTALGSDVVTVSGTGAGLFADKNVGTGKAVTVSGYTLSGADAGNYSIVQPTGVSADITPALVTGTLQGLVSKPYDGQTSASLSSSNYLLSGWINGEGATVTQILGTFDTPNSGAGKLVTAQTTASNFVANSGTDLSNYTLPSTISGAVGTITQDSSSSSGGSAAVQVPEIPEVKVGNKGSARSQTYDWPALNALKIAENPDAGLLAITILSSVDSTPTAAAIAFEQDAENISLRTAAAPLVRPASDKVVFSRKLTEFLVANPSGKMVEFLGGMINRRLVIVAPSDDSKQLAKAEMNLVLAAAVMALGRETPIMLAKLEGVVFDLR